MRPLGISPAVRIRWWSQSSCNSSRIPIIQCARHHQRQRLFHSSPCIWRTHQRHLIAEGRTTTPINLEKKKENENADDKGDGGDDRSATTSQPLRSSPYYLSTAFSLFAKRASRPFPPPFLSLPSGSFSDPLTNHTRARARHPSVHGQLIKGVTNGDDAVVISDENFLCVNDGVGQWAQKERGHAALWARLIAHFWVLGVEGGEAREQVVGEKDMVAYLQRALEQTVEVTKTSAGEIQGTTTVCGAFLRSDDEGKPVVLATNLGDCAVWVLRPGNEEAVYKSKEQWHWFDCPRQLGTNSPDQPNEVAVCDTVKVEVGDLVLCVSDGVTDNLWENEICDKVTETMGRWNRGEEEASDGLLFVARELMKAAREVAEDPDAGSPYMERALDEGIPAEGGKLDDISVLIGLVKKRDGG